MLRLKRYELISEIVIQLLEKLNVEVIADVVDLTLQSHPDYPSILSIGDSLKKWSIDNVILKITNEELMSLPLPFIAYTNNKSEPFVIVTRLSKDSITYSNGTSKEKTENFDDFCNNWSNVVLAVKTNPHSGDPAYNINDKLKRKKRSRYIFLSCLTAILCTFPIFTFYMEGGSGYNSVYISVLILLKLIGVAISLLLIWHALDRDNPTIQSICSLSHSTDCNKVLNSKVSKVFKWLSWSEVGFFYFTGGLLAVIFAGNELNTMVNLLAILNLMALPYIVFSIFYQWKVAGSWCLLCLSIQAVLLFEFILSMAFGEIIIPVISYLQVGVFISSFTIPVIIYCLLKPVIILSQNAKKKHIDFQRIKYNKDVFRALLLKQKKAVNLPDIMITIGNPDADNTLMMVCSPYCKPCSSAHHLIKKIIHNIDLKVNILFTTNVDEDDKNSFPAKHLLQISGLNDKCLLEQALDDWFEDAEKNYTLFVSKYPVSGNIDLQNNNIIAMRKWCDEMDIAYTPTFFLNEYQIPDIYTLGDLRFLLQE